MKTNHNYNLSLQIQILDLDSLLGGHLGDINHNTSNSNDCTDNNHCDSDVAAIQSMTYEQIVQELAVSCTALDRAIATNDFMRCEEIEKKIQSLNEFKDKLPEPDPTDTRSRIELEEDLKKLRKDLSDSMKIRDFRRCDDINRDIEKIESMLAAIPSASNVFERIEVRV